MSESGPGSRGATDYLKGVAILAVYLNHFANGFLTDAFHGNAGGFVSIFFVLGGYGVACSLSRTAAGSGRFLGEFAKRRALRIYPLFWVWCAGHGFSNGVLGFFALDFVHTRSPWFIPSLVQCYLAAPLLFVALRRRTPAQSVAGLLAALVLVNAVLFGFTGMEVREVGLGYRGLFFLQVFLFGLGFVLAKLRGAAAAPRSWVLPGILLYVATVHLTAGDALPGFPAAAMALALLFAFATALCCHAVMTSGVRLPQGERIQAIGRYSYAIYLFHGISMRVLEAAGLLRRHEAPLANLLVLALFTPLFFLAYATLEIAVNEFVFGARKLANVRDAAAQTARIFAGRRRSTP